jgi:hypothetical protein
LNAAFHRRVKARQIERLRQGVTHNIPAGTPVWQALQMLAAARAAVAPSALIDQLIPLQEMPEIPASVFYKDLAPESRTRVIHAAPLPRMPNVLRILTV